MTAVPDLAIIIPCYNYERFVRQSILSVIDQQGPRCHLIVIDDGSTDNSWSEILSTGARCYRVSNGGARRACLHALTKTSSQFVLFLDADDMLKPGAVESILNNLDEKVAKLQFGLTRVDANGDFLSAARPKIGNFRDRLRLQKEVLKTGVYRSPPTSGNVFRRDLCELLFEADYDRFVDGITVFAAPFYGDVVSLADELGCYRIHGDNASNLGGGLNAEAIQKGMERFHDTMLHLQEILLKQGVSERKFDPHKLFTVRERKFYLDIASGKRPGYRAAALNITFLFRERHTIKEKFALAAVFMLGAILPNKAASDVVAYRLRPGFRSAKGLLGIISNAVFKKY